MKTKIDFKSILSVAIGILLFTGCNSEGDHFDYGKEVILITGTESNPLVRFVVEDTPASYTVTASATGKVSEDVTVTFTQDNSLVEAYNAEHKTSYYAIPESAIEVEGTEGIIKAGSASSTGINVRVVSTEDFIDGRVYVIPVTIKSVSGGNMEVLDASKTIYLRISRVIHFNSLDMTNVYFYGNYYADAPVDLPNYTYEIKCYINEWHPGNEPISRLCNFCPINESVTNLLRFGENGQDINSLQWVTPGGGLISSTRFNTGQWYTISITFDGSAYRMYVDGVKDAELAGNKGTIFQRLELGMSWFDSGTPASSYPYRQRFLGRIAEIRLWNRALTTSELQIGICGVDPASEGLVAYWKLNDGEGAIFKDETGHGYDIDWSKAWQNDQQYDKSSYVNWLLDDKNKCSQ
ncbi:MAG: BT_3987 domain-containing protein [Mangrovibacterium sp.]